MRSPSTAAMTDALTQPFALNLIEQKNGLSFVPHEYVRERLIEATGNQFDWTIDQVLFRDDGVTRRATNRETGVTPRPVAMIVIGTLTIPGLGSRAGIGAHPLDAGAGEDAAYKSAESDAFKRAAMAFGVGLRQLYIEKGVPVPADRKRSQRSAPPSPISDDVFASQIEQAIAEQDGASFRRLATTAGRSVRRWTIMIEATQTPAALDWIGRQLDRQNLSSPELSEAINLQREKLAA
jgi:hypothetical protein